MHKVTKAMIIILVVLVLSILVLSIIFISNMGVSSSCDIETSSKHYLQNQNKSDIVVTFTTMPDRLHSSTFKRVLCSMMDQTKRPSDIRLNIPWVSKRTQKDYIIPEWLKDMPITIFRCEDMGPATKIIPTLQFFQNNPHQKLVVYDDDSVMPENYISIMDKLSNQYPNHCITTASYRFYGSESAPRFKRLNFCDNLSVSKRINLVIDQANCFYDENEPTLTDMVTGWSGYLLTPNMITFDTYESLPKSAFFVDDVVVSGFLLEHGTPIMVSKLIPESLPTYGDLFLNWWHKCFKSTDHESLSFTSNHDQSHDDVMEHFFSPIWNFLDREKK
jgi:hypothetical protein